MSPEDVQLAPEDVIRKAFDAWNRGDFDSLAELYDANATVITDPSWMETGPFEGRAAIRDWYKGLRDSWAERNVVVITELLPAAGQVVARMDWQVRGRSSGIEMDFELTSVNAVEDGKIVRQQYYFNHAEALAAVGIAE